MPRILVITNVFPNAVEPNRGTYNLQQFAALREHFDIEVIAPTAWRTPTDREIRPAQRIDALDTPHGAIPVYHPRYYYIPGMLRCLYSRTYGRSIAGVVRKRWAEKPFDLIFGTWLYPDCVAAARLARRYGVPFIARNHGTDVHYHALFLLRRRQISWMARQAKCVFSVSSATADVIRRLSRDRARIEVLPNGVDIERFRIVPREEAREQLGLPLDERMILFVGALKPVKGLSHLIEALGRMRHEGNWRLHIIGDGPLRDRLPERIEDAGITDRVRMEGEVLHQQIGDWMNAADVLVLPSLNEGCPNVVLESQACGTPVVASRVGGVPDILDEKRGIMVPPGDAAALAEALRRALAHPWDREAIRRAVENYTWRDNAARLREAIEEALHDRPQRGAR